MHLLFDLVRRAGRLDSVAGRIISVGIVSVGIVSVGMVFVCGTWPAAALSLDPVLTPATTPAATPPLTPTEIPAKEVVSIETFSPPVRLQATAPKYPQRQLKRGQEGWVQLNFMVDTQGTPYDITVIDSSNEGDFERHAIKAAEKWEYQPAEFDGTAIDAGETMFVTFALQGQTGAGRTFVRRYRSITKLIEKKDRAGVDSELEKMSAMSRNLYEEAYFHLVQYNYHLNWGQDPQMMYDAISRASTMDQGRGFLPDDVLTSLLLTKLSLELAQNKLADARLTVVSLQKRKLDADQRSRLAGVTEDIDQVRQSAASFSVAGTIPESNRGTQLLLQNKFSVNYSSGDIAELRLHCDRGYVGFVYKPDVMFSVRDDWSDCRLILIGTPGTEYRLLQSGS